MTDRLMAANHNHGLEVPATVASIVVADVRLSGQILNLASDIVVLLVDTPAQMLASCLRQEKNNAGRGVAEWERQIGDLLAFRNSNPERVVLLAQETAADTTQDDPRLAKLVKQVRERLFITTTGSTPRPHMATTLAQALIATDNRLQTVANSFISALTGHFPGGDLKKTLHSAIQELESLEEEHIYLCEVLAKQDVRAEQRYREYVRQYIYDKSNVNAGEIPDPRTSVAEATSSQAESDTLKRFGDSVIINHALTYKRGEIDKIRLQLLSLSGNLLLNPRQATKHLEDDNGEYTSALQAIKHIERDDPLRQHFERCLAFSQRIFAQDT